LIQEDLHQQQNANLEGMRREMNDEKDHVVNALKQQHATLLQRMQEELDALKKRGMYFVSR
jgi:hypothetical protein